MKSDFVKTIVLLCVIAALIAIFGSRKKDDTQQETLNLFCWADYISPDLIKEFEKANNCHVVYDTFDSNEALLAKLQAGACTYDIIFPSHYIVNILADKGIIQRLNYPIITSAQYLDNAIVEKMPEGVCDYSIPYMVSYTGIGYDKDAMKDFEPSWTQFERTDLQKRATLLDDKREVIGVAMMTLGIDPNSTEDMDLLKAKEVVRKWKPNISKFENEQYKNGLASKEFKMVMGYSGDIVQIMDGCPHVGFAIPKEGTTMSCDVMAIPTQAKHVELAYKFINFIHEPENAARNMEYVYYMCPNKASYPLVSEEVKGNPAVFVDSETLARCKFIIDQKENEEKFNVTWEDIKMGQ